MNPLPVAPGALEETVARFGDAAAAKKCWSCGCLHSSLATAERAFAADALPPRLAQALGAARSCLLEVRYDCLGCEVCYPARALDALGRVPGAHTEGAEACPSEPVAARTGWPPLPGDYTVLRYRAPVAICTLIDHALAAAIARQAPDELALVGTLQTENLGIERLVANVVANPNIRFLIVAGADSRSLVGHLPGQSLLALARCGVDERGRIVGARGKRPILRNIERDAIEHFRRTVEMVDLVGRDDAGTVLGAVKSCAQRDLGPTDPFTGASTVAPISGYLPERMVPDPAGYVIVYVDRARGLLSLEHYRNDGGLGALVEGRTASEVYTPVVERGLVSRLDHAAYLGRELTRAEHALSSGTRYVQDGAPEQEVAPAQAARRGGAT
jgi:tetrahydromethanopterin S-methyltransferase subunit A